MKNENASTSDGYSAGKATAGLSEIFQQLESKFRQFEQQIADAGNIVEKGHALLERIANEDDHELTNRYHSGLSHLNEPGAMVVEDTMTDNSTLRIYTFGRFRVRCAGQAIADWHNNRAKSILKILLIHGGGPVSKDVFMESLWPASSLRSANSSFRVAMHELRRTFSVLVGEDVVRELFIYDGSNYYLSNNANIWIDSIEFERLFNNASELERENRLDESVRLYRKAEKIYAGDFLEEDVYEDWALVRREGLIDSYLSILSKLSDHYFGAEDYESCVEYCQKILAKDVCREDTYQRLIVCHSRLGQTSRAIRWYQVCKATLQKELNCDISPKTETLYRSVANRSRV